MPWHRRYRWGRVAIIGGSCAGLIWLAASGHYFAAAFLAVCGFGLCAFAQSGDDAECERAAEFREFLRDRGDDRKPC